MNPVVVRNVRIGEGIPKICAPLTGVTEKEIIEEAEVLVSRPVDIAEWRADWFAGASDLSNVKEVLAHLRKTLEETPLLFTFRTRKEGGERGIPVSQYEELNRAVAASGYADLIDVGLFTGDLTVKNLIEEAHRFGVRVIVSSHDFERTPEKDEIVARLLKMQELGADILKIAVMPRCRRDVLTLLEATEEMNRVYADRPVVTMSMSRDGVISRLGGGVFGSAITFGTVGRASAPGQIRAEDLKAVLELLHT